MPKLCSPKKVFAKRSFGKKSRSKRRKNSRASRGKICATSKKKGMGDHLFRSTTFLNAVQIREQDRSDLHTSTPAQLYTPSELLSLKSYLLNLQNSHCKQYSDRKFAELTAGMVCRPTSKNIFGHWNH